MATQIQYATGSVSGASTFKTAEVGTGALTLIRNNSTALASNTAINGVTFTITAAKVIEGVLLWVNATAATPAGTLKVALQLSGVDQASVTVNCADLPPASVLFPVPCFFKFTSTATGDGSANWRVVMTTSNNANATINYARNSASAGDFTKALRTSTTATRAAADDIYAGGEFTGAGTHNSYTLTWDDVASGITQIGNGTVNSTAANGGGLRVMPYGTVNFSNSASTAYYLQCKGDIEVFWNGTFNCGVAGGSEIPRGSGSAIMELVMNAASGDFGLLARNGSTVSIAGLSPSAGKNIIWTKLTLDTTVTTGLSNLSVNNGTNVGSKLSPAGLGLDCSGFTDNATSAGHWVSESILSIPSSTQVGQVWLAQGTGTHNRFVRLFVGTTNSVTPTNGFFADIDLLNGTIGACTAIGNGTATSSSIQAYGSGYICTIIGKGSSGASIQNLIIAACSASGTVSYAGDSTDCFHYSNAVLVTAASLGDFTYNVADNTGWLSGSAVAVGPSGRTAGDRDLFLLSANAGAASFVTHMNPFGFGGPTQTGGTYYGTSPTQSPVGLITMNVKFRSSSNSLWTYFYAEPLATVTVQWCQFTYLGAGTTATKRGVEIASHTASGASAKSFTYCSFMWSSYGVYLNNATVGAVSVNLTVDHCVFYVFSNQPLTTLSITNSDWTYTNNLVIKSGGTAGLIAQDPFGTCTGNIFSGNTGVGIDLTPPSTVASPIVINGNFDNNICHTNSSHGFNLVGSGTGVVFAGSISNLTAWRNAGDGYGVNSNLGTSSDLILINPILFGNTTAGALTGCDGLRIQGGTICSDTSFNQPVGVSFGNINQGIAAAFLDGVDMSGSGGVYAPNSTDIQLTQNCVPQIRTRGCKFGAAALYNTRAWSGLGFIGFENFNQTVGDHRTELAFGQIRSDPTIFNNVSPSERVTPIYSNLKCPSMPIGLGKLGSVKGGDALTISVPVYLSQASDGQAYNGNQPRLMLRSNGALGVNTDQVLATYTGGAGAWNVLTGTTPVATDAGQFEFYVDCDGTLGWINVDNPGWQVSAP